MDDYTGETISPHKAIVPFKGIPGSSVIWFKILIFNTFTPLLMSIILQNKGNPNYDDMTGRNVNRYLVFNSSIILNMASDLLDIFINQQNIINKVIKQCTYNNVVYGISLDILLYILSTYNVKNAENLLMQYKSSITSASSDLQLFKNAGLYNPNNSDLTEIDFFEKKSIAGPYLQTLPDGFNDVTVSLYFDDINTKLGIKNIINILKFSLNIPLK